MDEAQKSYLFVFTTDFITLLMNIFAYPLAFGDLPNLSAHLLLKDYDFWPAAPPVQEEL